MSVGSTPVIIRYDRAIVDSLDKTAKKAQELEVLSGVQNASALKCVGMVMVSCNSAEVQQQLIHDMSVDPSVEFAGRSDHELHHCSQMPAGNHIEDLRLAMHLVAGNETTLGDAWSAPDVVEGSVTVPSLQKTVASEIQTTLGRIIAASFADLKEGDVRVVKVRPTQFKVSVPAATQRTVQTKRRALRSCGAVRIDFQVKRPADAADDDVMEAVRTRLEQLSEGGRAAERFDALLDAELQAMGISLPDWAQSHFSAPKKKQAGDNKLDEGSIVAIVVMMMVIVPVLLFSLIFFMFTSPMSAWDY